MALKFGIVGSGPAGFFTAKSLIKQFPHCKIDMFEKLPVPFGLIRYGVAPDHSEIKRVTQDFSALAREKNFRFFGDVSVGQDISYKVLSDIYSAVIYAYGSASSDKVLSIPGGDLTKSARNFVEWYNSKPGIPDLDLKNVTKVMIIGNGNVAMDVARILSSRPDRLINTDIDLSAYSALCSSSVKEIDIIGRRGPVQAAMTVKELRFLSKVPGISIRVFQDEIDRGLNEESIEEGQVFKVATNQAERAKKRLFELINSFPRTHSEGARVKVNLRFLLAPIGYSPPFVRLKETYLTGDKGNQVAEMSGCVEEGLSDLVVRSIGYRSEKIDVDLPFDEEAGVVKNIGGKVESNNYVAGWARTGPFGVIDTTMRGVFYTVDSILQDFREQKLAEKNGDVLDYLSKRFVDFEMWEKIDKFEVGEGMKLGKSRVKVKDLSKMREIAFS